MPAVEQWRIGRHDYEAWFVPALWMVSVLKHARELVSVLRAPQRYSRSGVSK